jgi:hypothetical protein
MVQNVEQILSRGERIELLVDKTDNMASQATAFRRGARTVRRQMWWKNKRVLGLGVLVALVRTPCLFPTGFVPEIDTCVLSGDSLDDYGTVLWGGAALRSKVNTVACGHRVFLLRSDLIGICCCFSDFACFEFVLRKSVLLYLLLLYAPPVSGNSIPTASAPLPTSGASSANLSGHSDFGAHFESK